MIILDYRDKRPIYEQVVEKLERLIVGGGLEANTKMPSVRSLALELAVNPNTIQRAYAQLEQDGYLYTVSGRGSFVAHESEWRNAKEKQLTEKLKGVVEEAKEAGMVKEQIISVVTEVYQSSEETAEADKNLRSFKKAQELKLADEKNAAASQIPEENDVKGEETVHD
ncbi:MAG: GntR family transcriptional regulator [Lachnospiraceae bacterium]|nr:GntR family transcriptional regulator [Lachnospiraceae bacterium]